MLHVIWIILKILLFILVCLLGLLLLVMLLLLFVPLRYQGQIKPKEGKITWLLHLVSVRIQYKDKQPDLQVRLCGICVLGGEKKEEKKALKTPQASKVSNVSKATEDVSQGDNVVSLHSRAASRDEITRENASDVMKVNAQPARDSVETISRNRQVKSKQCHGSASHNRSKLRNKIKRFFKHLSGSLGNLRNQIASIKSKLEYYRRFWYDNHTRAAITHAKKELFYILRHVRPRKVEGWLHFGFDDPATTGEVLGILSVLQSFSGNHLTVDADFEKKRFDGDFSLKGHVRLVHFLKAFLALLLDKHCRITFRRLRSK